MTLTSARVWLVAVSLSLVALQFMFFVIAPAVHYPLDFDQGRYAAQTISRGAGVCSEPGRRDAACR